jgi:hypothetical protein
VLSRRKIAVPLVSMGEAASIPIMPKSRWLPVLLLVAFVLGLALLAGAVAGTTVAIFLSLTVLLGGLAVLMINARS